ncbi:MAG: hypothetical protein SGPRY_003231 [Prymnesium sp.]
MLPAVALLLGFTASPRVGQLSPACQPCRVHRLTAFDLPDISLSSSLVILGGAALVLSIVEGDEGASSPSVSSPPPAPKPVAKIEPTIVVKEKVDATPVAAETTPVIEETPPKQQRRWRDRLPFRRARERSRATVKEKAESKKQAKSPQGTLEEQASETAKKFEEVEKEAKRAAEELKKLKASGGRGR